MGRLMEEKHSQPSFRPLLVACKNKAENFHVVLFLLLDEYAFLIIIIIIMISYMNATGAWVSHFPILGLLAKVNRLDTN